MKLFFRKATCLTLILGMAMASVCSSVNGVDSVNSDYAGTEVVDKQIVVEPSKPAGKETNVLAPRLSTNNPYLGRSGYNFVNSGKKTFELVGKSKTKNYDTMQGGCTDGKYAYFVLYDRTRQKCKISKVRMSDWKVVKVSKVVHINHGNDITYDSKRKCLVAVHLTKYKMRLTIINPTTLEEKCHKDINPSEGVTNLDGSVSKNIKALYGIAYNEKKDQYIVGISGLNDFLILDGDLEVKTYWQNNNVLGYLRQSLDTEGDFVYLAQSFNGNYSYNIIAIYTWDGQYVGRILIKRGQELENVFHVNGQFYAGFYESRYVRQKKKWKLVRSGYVCKLQFKNSAKIVYSSGGGKGKMNNSTLYYGIKRTINSCKYKKKGYKFKGWQVYRFVDKKYYGYNKKGKLGWYLKRQIEKYKLYKNKATIAKTASKGTIKFTAKWQKVKAKKKNKKK